MTGQENLPSKCPKCGKEVEWNWSDDGFDTEAMCYTAECPECHVEFLETYECSGWEIKE